VRIRNVDREHLSPCLERSERGARWTSPDEHTVHVGKGMARDTGLGMVALESDEKVRNE
jgi:hypothetical protein